MSKYYVVFEAGSRAGLSAEVFFRAWRKQNGWNEGEGDTLILADSDPLAFQIPADTEMIRRVDENDGIDIVTTFNDIEIFPADEFTRQCNDAVRAKACASSWSKVNECWYDKAYMNCILGEVEEVERYPIHIPLTFSFNDVCIKPNSMSAGSKHISLEDGVCVSQAIDIKHEYVVDVFRNEELLYVYPREVQLRAGYDKFIKILEPNGKIGTAVANFIFNADKVIDAFSPSGVFHIQLAEDSNGDLFYIESSRRISGTSLVNLFFGFNPFSFKNCVSAKVEKNPFKYNQWYRYEDFVFATSELIYSK